MTPGHRRRIGSVFSFVSFFHWLLLATLAPLAHSAVAGARPPVLTVVTEQYRPMSYTENGQLRGYAVDIAKAMLARAELDYRIDLYPWARAYAMAQSQPNVLIFSIVRTPERENQFNWIGPIGRRNVYLYKMAARTELRLGSLDDLVHYTTSVNRGDVVQAQLEQRGLKLGAQIDPSNTALSGLNKLRAGRVDFIPSTEFAVAALCAQAGIARSQLERSLLLSGATEYYIAASRGTPEATITRLRQELEKLRKAGFMRAVAAQYGVTAALQ